MSALSASVALLLSLTAAQPTPAQPLDTNNRAVRTALLKGATAALRGEKAAALRNLERAALLGADVPGVQSALGTAALLLGDLNTAKRVLRRTPDMAVYRAMALSHGPGGFARARTELAQHIKGPLKDRNAGAMFLAALAFADAKQKARAHKILDAAIRRADGALDEAFAPDPAIGLARSVQLALRRLGGAAEGRAKLAMALLQANRRGAAFDLAEKSLKNSRTRTAALRVLVLVENAVQAKRSLKRIRRILRVEPDAVDAGVAEVVLRMRLGQRSKARAAIERLPPVDDPALQADLARAEAALLLAAGDEPESALEATDSALRADPMSNVAVELHVRALLAAGKVDRAEAFAGALLKRKPIDADPFALLEAVETARKNVRKANDMRLRSRGFRADLNRLEAVVREREAVIRGVRQAEASGIGVVGLEALRGEHPALSLPIDLALARHGSRGFARAARDRILAACAPRLRKFLTRKKGWSWTPITIAPYGKARRLESPLTAADPARCRRAQLRK